MCVTIEKCCFCVELETATKAIALMEGVVAIPCLVQGVASLSVINMAAGLLLFVNAWVLFDGTFLERKALLMTWLVATLGKIIACLLLGSLFAFFVVESESLDSSSVIYPLKKLGKSYISCLLNWTDQETLFFVVYAIAFFALALVYCYFFSVVYSFREKVIRKLKKMRKMRRKRRRMNRAMMLMAKKNKDYLDEEDEDNYPLEHYV